MGRGGRRVRAAAIISCPNSPPGDTRCRHGIAGAQRSIPSFQQLAIAELIERRIETGGRPRAIARPHTAQVALSVSTGATVKTVPPSVHTYPVPISVGGHDRKLCQISVSDSGLVCAITIAWDGGEAWRSIVILDGNGARRR